MQNVDNYGNENVVTSSYKIKFIDSTRFVECLLSNIVDNLAEEICRILCKDCDCFFEHESANKNLINCICICNKIYSKKIDEHFKNRFKSKFSVSISIN